MALSSINFQKATAHAFRHNDRSDMVTYLVDRSDQNEVSRSATEAKALADQLYADAIAKLTAAKVKRKPKAENSRWEAVVNLNAGHTLEDVQRLAKRIEEETGFTVLQIAVHKDEGKSASDKNYHAHIVFHTLDRQTGRQLYRREHMTPKMMTALQDLTAETLGMQRGKRGSKRKRLNHTEYKAVAQEREAQQERIEQLETELANVKDVAAQYKAERERLKASGKAKQKDYQELKKQYDELKARAKADELTIAELKAAVTDKDKVIEEQAEKIASLENKMQQLAEVAGVDEFSPDMFADYEQAVVDSISRQLDAKDTSIALREKEIEELERRTAKFKEQAEIIERQREIIEEQTAEVAELKADMQSMTEQRDQWEKYGKEQVAAVKAKMPAPDYIEALEADRREKKRLQEENASLKKELQQAKAKIADLEAQLKERSTMRERQSNRKELNAWERRRQQLVKRMTARANGDPSLMSAIEDAADKQIKGEQREIFGIAKRLYEHDVKQNQKEQQIDKQIEQQYYEELQEDEDYDPWEDYKGPGM